MAYDGQQAAFASIASNLVSEDTNASWDIFMHEIDEGASTARGATD